MKGKSEDTNIAQNRKARHDYEVLETMEAGIELVGSEVKSCRNHGVSLADCYIDHKDGELFAVGVHIAPYAEANQFNHETKRRRRLLMHKKEIRRLAKSIEAKGLTLIPLSFYFKKGRVKVQVGLCRGKNVHDKRETLKKQSDQRDIQRALHK